MSKKLNQVSIAKELKAALRHHAKSLPLHRFVIRSRKKDDHPDTLFRVEVQKEDYHSLHSFSVILDPRGIIEVESESPSRSIFRRHLSRSPSWWKESSLMANEMADVVSAIHRGLEKLFGPDIHPY